MTSVSPDFLTDSVIVAAHPDDEALWFSSILARVGRVILVFRRDWRTPGIGASRSAALAEHPHPNVSCLDIDEAGVFGCGQWSAPQVTPAGIGLGLKAARRSLTLLGHRLSGGDAVPAASTIAAAYAGNTLRIAAALRPLLHGGMNVFTHNPWGEYGHEEHVQVFRAVDALRREIGFTQWMTNYVSERSLPLALRYFSDGPTPFLRLPTDPAYGEAIADIYRRHGCWTWADRWSWFEDECVLEAPADVMPQGPHRHLSSLNVLSVGRSPKSRPR